MSSLAALPALGGTARAQTQKDSIPIGLELYSVRAGLKADLMGTVAAVARMGYQVVEFYSPYFEWTPAYAKEVRKHLDDLGIECRSTHSPARAFAEENRDRAAELNQILGSKTIVMASPGRRVSAPDDWKRVSETLAQAHERFRAAGISVGYHNHQYEWSAFEGETAAKNAPRHAMDILAAGTPHSLTLQLDVGTCVEMGRDPVAWVRAHPGRTRSIHLKDWAPGEEPDEKGYRVLFGEGAAPWREVIEEAESVGGVEYYLMEQEGSRYSELETAERCLGNVETDARLNVRSGLDARFVQPPLRLSPYSPRDRVLHGRPRRRP